MNEPRSPQDHAAVDQLRAQFTKEAEGLMAQLGEEFTAQSALYEYEISDLQSEVSEHKAACRRLEVRMASANPPMQMWEPSNSTAVPAPVAAPQPSMTETLMRSFRARFSSSQPPPSASGGWRHPTFPPR
jgi:hypothetical protein